MRPSGAGTAVRNQLDYGWCGVDNDRTSSGHSIPVWRRQRLPRIHDAILQSSIYLYPSEKDAREGARAGGSGFLIGIRANADLSPKPAFVYAVTNRHVVFETSSPVVRVNKMGGGFDVIPYEQDDWLPDPSGADLAILHITSLKGYECAWLSDKDLLSREVMDSHSIGVGDEAFMIGRFVNHEGKQRNLPSARFGHIAMMPLEPIEHPYYAPQESFGVEIRSIGGYSGSPVIVQMQPFTMRPHDNEGFKISMEHSTWILGVEWGQITSPEGVLNFAGQPMSTGQHVRARTGMVGVIPAWRLTELLNHPRLKMHREKMEKQLAEKVKQGPVSTVDSVAAAPSTKADNP